MDKDNDYIRSIAAYFLEKKGKGLILSPGDMALLSAWDAENVPGGAVIRGIDRAFASLDNVLSLQGCRKFVDEEVRKLPRFVPRPTAEDKARERIDAIVAILNRAAQKCPGAIGLLDNAARRVDNLKELLTGEAEIAIGEELAIIENGLADSLLNIHDADEISAARRRIDTSLTGIDFASAEARLSTIKETMRVWILLQYDVDFSVI